jgi:hypothetical protein
MMLAVLICVLLVCFFRPVLGFGLYLLLHCSIFYLSDHLYRAVPAGGFLLIYGVLYLGSRRAAAAAPRRLQGRVQAYGLVQLVILYLGWRVFVSVVGATLGVSHDAASAMREAALWVAPFALLPILWNLRDRIDSLDLMVRTAALFTAIMQIVVAVSGSASLMRWAYLPDPTVRADWMESAIAGGQGWAHPAGTLFFMLVGVRCFAELLTGKRRLWNSIQYCVTLVSVVSTASRSHTIAYVAGTLCAVALVLHLPRARRLASLGAAFGVLVICFGAAVAYVPANLLARLEGRFGHLQSEGSQLLSENPGRGAGNRAEDNRGALEAIQEHPILGWGSSVGVRELSHRRYGPGTDSHTLLCLASVGGVPLAFAYLALHLLFFSRTLKDARPKSPIGLDAYPYAPVAFALLLFVLAGTEWLWAGYAIPLPVFMGLFLCRRWKARNLSAANPGPVRRGMRSGYNLRIRSSFSPIAIPLSSTSAMSQL